MTQTGRRKSAVIVVAAVAVLALIFLWVRSPSEHGAAGAAESAGNPAARDARTSSPDDGRMPPLPDQDSASSPAGTAAPSLPVPGHLPSVDAEDPVEYDTKLPADTLYAELPAARSHFADKLPFGVDDRDYIEFNRDALRGLKAGSTMTLRTPDDGREHQVHIDEVQVHPNGDKSWFGRVDDGKGGAMPAVFTQGVDSSFGSFNTATGSYSLEAEGRMGWIANVNDLRKHQDFNIPDVLEPDPSRGRPEPSGN